ncbi:hypothetical protein B0H67DRAFT_652072 [Lasiosphaeris hirsuta]|uniref:Conidiation-specific protein 13 n=1 Tax=Lasiosphaeris hirsuta TaxID=260670 RepID=A0AA40B9Q0_9PEZI|nr:hypothetical protein B0H67DRAFT_652072 [Lasiosphaeris hirsuta]
MFRIVSSVLAVASLAGTALSQLENKPFLYDWGQIEQYGPLLRGIWQQDWNIVNFTTWDDVPDKRDQIPVACTGAFDDWLAPFKSADFTVYEVLYNDCDQPFHLCYHKDVSQNTIGPIGMIYNWGLVPIGMRQYVGNAVVIPIPNDPNLPGRTAHQAGPSVVFQEDFFVRWSVIAHELSHSVDMYKSSTPGLRFSESAEWRTAVGDDSHLSSVYGRSNYVEEFAEIGIMAAYDIGSEGRLPDVEPDWTKVEHQLDFVTKVFGTDLMLGRTGCPAKVGSTYSVPKSDEVGARVQLPEGTELFTPTEPYPDSTKAK